VAEDTGFADYIPVVVVVEAGAGIVEYFDDTLDPGVRKIAVVDIVGIPLGAAFEVAGHLHKPVDVVVADVAIAADAGVGAARVVDETGETAEVEGLAECKQQ